LRSLALRSGQVGTVLDDIKAYLERERPVLPKSPEGQASSYRVELKALDSITASDGQLDIDE